MSDHESRARSYYRALDEHAYDDLAALLAPEFVHERPDMTLEGRERFVEFMREERPMMDTSHPVDAVFESEAGDVAVQGRLLDSDGNRIVSFVDVFSFEGESVSQLRTFTHP